MSRNVREQKLDSIAKCLERLKEKMPRSEQELVSDQDVQDIVMINLERLVQLSVDVALILITEKNWQPMPSTMAAAFDVLFSKKMISSELCNRLKKSVGFRNIAVHEYDKINWAIVYTILTKHLKDFKEYAKIMDEA